MAFISCRSRLTKVLPDAAKVKKGSKAGGGQVRLSNVGAGRLLGLKYRLICLFKLAADMVGGGIWKFVNDTERLAFLERELMRLGVNGY